MVITRRKREGSVRDKRMARQEENVKEMDMGGREEVG